MTATRRGPRFVRIDAIALFAGFPELDRADPAAAKAVAGRPLGRSEAARLRKRLLTLALPGRVDHRSGAYAAAKRRVAALWRAVAQPLDP